MKLPRISRRLLACLRRRLEASPLPVGDRVRLDLDAELIALAVASEGRSVTFVAGLGDVAPVDALVLGQ